MRLTRLTSGASLLLAVLSSIFSSGGGVRAYQLTSQYLGTAPSRDNEHLLLFKLPETISSQLLVESNNLNLNQQQQHLNHQNAGLYVGQQNNNNNYNNNNNNNNLKPTIQYSTFVQQAPQAAQQYELKPTSAAVQEQAVSLTIPLLSSALHADEPTVRPAPVQFQSQQQQPANRHQQALESALAEYLVHANGNNNQQADTVASLYAQAAQQGDALIDQQQNSADLTALGQLQLAQQLSLLAGANQPDESSHRASQYSQLQLLAENQQQQANNYSVPPSNQQPRLWRDTQISYAPPAHVSPMSSSSAAHIQSNNNHSDVSSLVARLANSSPDLLIRLKNLLKKTTSSSSRLVASSSQTSSTRAAPLYEHLKLSSPSENLRPLESLRHSLSVSEPTEGPGNDYFMANNVGPRELKQLIQNYLDQTRPGHSEGGGGGDDPPNSLRALLSNSNVSSHEEIKIPLILIAMPRILSFRKNNTGTIGNSSSLPSISKVLAQRLVNQLPHLLEAAANNNLTQRHNSYNNNNNNATTTSNLFQLDSGSSRANVTTDGGGRQVYWIGQQQQQQQSQQSAASTTSVPAHVHTMAPYAQQFITPRLVAGPPHHDGAGGRFIPMLSQSHSPPQTTTTYQVMSPGVPMRQSLEANQSDVYLAGRKSTGDSSRNQVLSLINAHGDAAQGGDVGFQVQLIGGGGGSSSNEASDNQQQKQYSHSLPFYEAKQTLEPPNDTQQEEQRMIYVAPAAGQRRSISSSPLISRFQLVNSTTSEEPVAAAAQLRPPYDPATRLQTSYNDHQRDPVVSRLSLMEEQISKLRPLFQSAGKRSNSAPDNRTKLSPSQLMTLFSRSTARRSWTAPQAADEGEQQSVDTQRQAANGPGGTKKSPKMVLMFV